MGAKKPSHRDGSFEYPQNMLWSRNKKNNISGTHSRPALPIKCLGSGVVLECIDS